MATIENCERVLEFVGENPKKSLTVISDALKLNFYQVRDSVKFLKKHKILDVEQHGRAQYVILYGAGEIA